MKGFSLTHQTIEVDMHSSIPSSDGSGMYVIKSDLVLKAQVSYTKCPNAHSFHSCCLSPSLYLWPHEEFPMTTLLSTLFSWTHSDLEVGIIISSFISISRKLKHRMGNTSPGIIWLELGYDAKQSDTKISLPQACHTIISKVPQRSRLALLLFLGNFYFSVTERDVCMRKSEERKQAIYPKDTSVKWYLVKLNYSKH